MVGRLAARSTGLPMIHHLHSPTSGDTTHRFRNFVNAFIERRSIGNLAAAIAVSNSLASYGTGMGIPLEQVHVVHNGVPIVPTLAERPTPVGTWTLGCMALFRPRKGLEVLIEALAELRRNGVDAHLRAVGRFETPDYERTIHELAVRLGVEHAIAWRGFRSDIAAELAAMDLFVLPSLFGEGLPMVVLEAMSYGIPIVGTRVEGVPEAVRENVDGLIAEPGDAHSLADQIQRVIAGGSRLAGVAHLGSSPTIRTVFRRQHGLGDGRGLPPRAGVDRSEAAGFGGCGDRLTYSPFTSRRPTDDERFALWNADRADAHARGRGDVARVDRCRGAALSLRRHAERRPCGDVGDAFRLA